ncbi:MAG: serine/threonine-protein phosphatase [Chloroflexi bacterium]|nr:serine/threonine-protein phosphatase [Chloroflexota bacterium]
MHVSFDGTSWSAGLRVAHGTRPGAKARGNEDAALVCAPPARPDAGLLCAVADGVGGLAHGAAAAQAAVQTTAAAYLAAFQGEVPEALRAAVLAAHRAVRHAAAGPAGEAGGATTLVASVVREAEVWVANAGDSRAYLITCEGAITQITHDHSWVQEQVRAGTLAPEQAATHPWRKVITRCLGGEAAPDVDLFHRRLSPGCRVLLCSDGLTEVVQDHELAAAVVASEPDAAVAALLDLAERRGARDDVTLCVVAFPAFPTATPPPGTAGGGDAAPAPRAAGQAPRAGRGRVALWPMALLASAAVAALTVGAAWTATEGRIAPGVTVAGVHLGGLTSEAAAAAVVAGVTPSLTCPQVLRAGEREWVRTPAELGLWVDGAATAARAEQIGHQGTLPQQARERALAALAGVRVEPVLQVDHRVLHGAIAGMAADSQATPPVTQVNIPAAMSVVTARLLERPCVPVALPVEGPADSVMDEGLP